MEYDPQEFNGIIEPRPTGYHAGNGLFSKVQIGLTDEIYHVEAPFVTSLDTARLKDTCYNCMLFFKGARAVGRDERETDKTLRGCSGCKVAKYCGLVGVPSFATSTTDFPMPKEDQSSTPQN